MRGVWPSDNPGAAQKRPERNEIELTFLSVGDILSRCTRYLADRPSATSLSRQRDSSIGKVIMTVCQVKARLISWLLDLRRETSEGPWATNVDVYSAKYFSSSLSFSECLDDVLTTGNYSTIQNLQHTDDSLEFYEEYFSRSCIDIASIRTEESELIPTSMKRHRAGKVVSTDLYSRYSHLDVIRKSLSLPDNPIIYEVGAGHGALARLLKSELSVSTYLICDLPETLFFSAGFLLHNFPTSSVALVTPENAELIAKKIADYDFVFIPAGLDKNFRDIEIDLFINMHSFAEMTGEYIKHYFEYLNGTRGIRNFLLINRYLNVTDSRLTNKWEGEACIYLDHSWVIKYWCVDPEFAQSPGDRFTPQYLCMTGTRRDIPLSDTDRRILALQLLKKVDAAPEFVSAKRLVETMYILSNDLIQMARPNRRPCFCKGGILYNLFEAIRLYPCPETFFYMLVYLRSLNYPFYRFNETLAYNEWANSKAWPSLIPK